MPFYCKYCRIEGNPSEPCTRCGIRRWTTAVPSALFESRFDAPFDPRVLDEPERPPFALTDYDRILLIHYGYPAADVCER